MERRTFGAMGTEVEVLLDAEPGAAAERALDRVELELRRLEALLSRFRPDSELTRLNAAGALDAGPELLELVDLALDARERTGGRFDPTVHDALVAAGYDRTFAEVDGSAFGPSAPAGGGVRIRGTRIELDPGVRLDLGGIAKGWAVDRAVAALAPTGPCLVNAGGDLAVSGLPAEGHWAVGLDTPAGALTLGLADGALATTGRDRRRWHAGGAERHHVIDPATGRPADTDLLTVTVAGRSAVEAEVRAKALFLAGFEAAALEAEATGVPAVLVTEAGDVRLVGGLR
jgi:thiamine biosynthesis lipoprotein